MSCSVTLRYRPKGKVSGTPSVDLWGVDLPGPHLQRRDSAEHWGTPGICSLDEHRDDSAIGTVLSGPEMRLKAKGLDRLQFHS